MSLKAFHIGFVLVASLFSLIFGVWAIQMFLDWGEGLMLVLALASFLCLIALGVYGVWFYKKVKGWSYL